MLRERKICTLIHMIVSWAYSNLKRNCDICSSNVTLKKIAGE
jgi:hypothetical protein